MSLQILFSGGKKHFPTYSRKSITALPRPLGLVVSISGLEMNISSDLSGKRVSIGKLELSTRMGKMSLRVKLARLL
jgi:hypothetical protein